MFSHAGKICTLPIFMYWIVHNLGTYLLDCSSHGIYWIAHLKEGIGLYILRATGNLEIWGNVHCTTSYILTQSSISIIHSYLGIYQMRQHPRISNPSLLIKTNHSGSTDKQVYNSWSHPWKRSLSSFTPAQINLRLLTFSSIIHLVVFYILFLGFLNKPTIQRPNFKLNQNY